MCKREPEPPNLWRPFPLQAIVEFKPLISLRITDSACDLAASSSFFFLQLDMNWISQHAVGYVSGDQYYGAKASINVWAPRVSNQYEFSLSQTWLISGSFGNDLNTIEAGWQASQATFH